MPIDPKTLKTFTLRMPKDLWVFLRSTSTAQGIPAGTILINCLNTYKKKLEKRLTQE